jgi:hypothetical protein
MLRLLPLLVSLSVTINSFGQVIEEVRPDNVDMGEGSLVMNDGTELKGVIRYNDTEGGVVSFDGGNRSGSWTPRSVAGFEFFDEVKKRQRVFFTLDFDDDKTGKRPTFFEIIKDFKSFAVLAKMDPIDIKKSNGSAAGFGNGNIAITVGTKGKIKVKQTETIYFMDANGAPQAYMKVIRKMVDRELYDRTKFKNKLVDEDLIKKYLKEPSYAQMVKYADDNELDLGVKDDFIKALDYYEQLIQKK